VGTLSFARALALTLSRAQFQPMRSYFDHEKLKVYQSAIGFITWSTDLLIHVETRAAVKDQLDRASTSVPLTVLYK
jgi:hypothetical protein